MKGEQKGNTSRCLEKFGKWEKGTSLHLSELKRIKGIKFKQKEFTRERTESHHSDLSLPRNKILSGLILVGASPMDVGGKANKNKKK